MRLRSESSQLNSGSAVISNVSFSAEVLLVECNDIRGGKWLYSGSKSGQNAVAVSV